jgi:hypothetical protein
LAAFGPPFILDSTGAKVMHSEHTVTTEGSIPHLVHKGHAYPVRLKVDMANPGKMQSVELERSTGFAYYALPGGGKATACAIKAKKVA